MLFKEFGEPGLPVAVFLHGGGLSWWSLKGVIDALEKHYHIIAPIIDGHGEDGNTPFLSMEDSASKLIHSIDTRWGGSVQLLAGLSIGAQIVVKALTMRAHITRFAVIESGLVYPLKSGVRMAAPLYKLMYGLIRQKGFSRLQAKTLSLPESLYDSYYEDSLRMSRESLINMTVSNSSLQLEEDLKATTAKVLLLVGSKELGIMIKSARRLKELLPQSRLEILPGLKHGELSIKYPLKYAAMIKEFTGDF